ncbi:MAG TPA: hypothetical protein VF791_05185 [Pyrinomonadaceae bacterium]
MKMPSLISAPVLLLALSGLIPGSHHVPQKTAVGNDVRPGLYDVEMSEARTVHSLTQARIPYSSKEGRFSITLPAGFQTFRHKAQTQPTAVGDIEVNMYNSDSPSGACIVSYSDYPPATFQGRSPQQILEDGRDGALKTVNGILEKQKTMTVQGHQGLSFYGTAKAGNSQIYFRFDYVFVQPRVYQIGYLTYQRAVLDSPAAQDYFKSFRIED